jgi:hypothetical protein
MQKKTDFVQISCTKESREKIRRLCKSSGMKIYAMIEKMIVAYEGKKCDK